MTAALLQSVPARSNRATHIMKNLQWQDVAIRAVMVAAGCVAAVLLVLKGQAPAVPALAIGATLGTFAMGRFGATG